MSKESPAVSHLRQLLDDHETLQAKHKTAVEERDLHQQHRQRLEQEVAHLRESQDRLGQQVTRLKKPPSDEESQAAFTRYLEIAQPRELQSADARILLQQAWDFAIRFTVERDRIL